MQISALAEGWERTTCREERHKELLGSDAGVPKLIIVRVHNCEFTKTHLKWIHTLNSAIKIYSTNCNLQNPLPFVISF